MTEVIYMEEWRGDESEQNPNYIQTFDANITKRGETFVVLDKTAFYPLGGGQPSDTGLIEWEGGESKVTEVLKKVEIRHFVDSVPETDRVQGILDWEKRFAHMKMHTAQHVLSSVVFKMFNAKTAGNQIHADHSRVDFQPIKFTEEDLANVEEGCNEIITRSVPVHVYEEERPVLEEKMTDQRYILDMIPKSIPRLRVVDILGVDICPCAGTHVKNTSELGKVHMLERRSKGKDIDRIVYELL
ncbi:MAG: alanyl-tRNA editing protein [Methanobacteriota archaeon]|nr:MAG: alanyl-tRNA editing protein [Euryarchaeota archaeon]